MRHDSKAWIVVFALTLACGGSESLTPDHEARAQEALKPFKKDLMATLTRALPGGGANAVDVCKVDAPKIAARQSSGAITMGRTSHRLRNPDNAPEDWMKPLLTSYVGSTRSDAKPAKMVVVDDARFGYVEPIYVNTVCLTCHGTTIAPSTQDALGTHYPHDQATGFSDGEFRGIFWVTMPIPS